MNLIALQFVFGHYNFSFMYMKQCNIVSCADIDTQWHDGLTCDGARYILVCVVVS